MTIRRRTYSLPDNAGQMIVTHDDDSHEFLVGYRAHPWEEWSRPIEPFEVHDDPGASSTQLVDQLRALLAAYEQQPTQAVSAETVHREYTDQGRTYPSEQPMAPVDKPT